MELVSEFESADHNISKVEMSKALFRGWTKDLHVTADSIMSFGIGCHEAVAKLIERKAQLDESEQISQNALITQGHELAKKYNNCEMKGNLAENRLSKKIQHRTRMVTSNLVELVANVARPATLLSLARKNVLIIEISKKQR